MTPSPTETLLSTIRTILQKRPHLWTFLFCCILLWSIAYYRLLHPGIWAEDGKIFLADALALGWRSFFIPYEGYFHLFTRIFLWIFSFFPILWLPGIITCFCFVLYAWMASLFARVEYRELVPSDLDRLAICLGFCLIPGLQEILGNFCNTHRILTLVMLMIFVKPTRIAFTRWDMILSFFIAGSAGEIVALIPALMYRIHRRVKESQGINRDLFVFGAIAFWTLANISARNTNTAEIRPDLFEIARATLAAWIFNFTLQPVVGWRFGENLFNHARPIFFLFSTAITLFIARYTLKSLQKKEALIPLAILGLCGIQILAWLVRPTDLFLYKDFYPGMWIGRLRNIHTLLFAGFFFWAIASSRFFKNSASLYVLIYFVLLTPVRISALGDTSKWPEYAARLERSRTLGCPKEVEFPVFPTGWGNLRYTSPIPIPNDCKE